MTTSKREPKYWVVKRVFGDPMREIDLYWDDEAHTWETSRTKGSKYYTRETAQDDADGFMAPGSRVVPVYAKAKVEKATKGTLTEEQFKKISAFMGEADFAYMMRDGTIVPVSEKLVAKPNPYELTLVMLEAAQVALEQIKNVALAARDQAAGEEFGK